MNIDISQFTKTKSIFTEREWEIMGFVVQGLTNEAIAEKLNLQVSTIKSHLYSTVAIIADRIDLNGYNPRVIITLIYQELKKQEAK